MSYKVFFVLFFLLTLGGCKETKVNPANERTIEEIDSVISQWENDQFFKLHPVPKSRSYYYHALNSYALHYSGNQFAMDGLLSEKVKATEELMGFAERAKSLSTKSHIETSASKRIFEHQITNARLSSCLDGIQCIKARLRNTSNHKTAPQKLQYTISIIQASENVNEFHAFVNRDVEFYIEKSLSRGEFIDIEFPVLLNAHWDKPYNISIQLRVSALNFYNYYLDTFALLAPNRKEYALSLIHISEPTRPY